MKINTIQGATFKEMLITGAKLLESNKALVDSLNVFPVPDGDTGTNMSMTMSTAVRELVAIKDQDASIAQIATTMSKGALRGARGNSGVILSQLFRGMARVLEKEKTMDAMLLAQALVAGSEAAYKAVMKPKEGTILTVARVVAQNALKAAQDGVNVYELIDIIVSESQAILAQTPDMLPVLKEAGVVDSGGKGLSIIYRGFKMALDGDNVEQYCADAEQSAPSDLEENMAVDSLDEIVFGYCTEFFVEQLEPGVCEQSVEKMREQLTRIGDSVVAVFDSDIIKIHVHTNMPGKALQMALRLGEVNGIKIDNMREQHRQLVRERKENEKEVGLVAIGVGEGIEKVFKDLAVDVVVAGGQTMNPSANDIQKAIKRVNARNVFVLPNNKNIILAANQAAQMLQDAQINVVVIPSNSISQGISAALTFDPAQAVSQITEAMQAAIGTVKSGQVTHAVRTTTIDGIQIKQGDYIAMIDGDLEFSDASLDEVSDKMIDAMAIDGDYITVFYGADVKKEQAEAFAARIEARCESYDVVLQYGGQPLYYYLVSVE